MFTLMNLEKFSQDSHSKLLVMLDKILRNSSLKELEFLLRELNSGSEGEEFDTMSFKTDGLLVRVIDEINPGAEPVEMKLEEFKDLLETAIREFRAPYQ